MNQEDARLNVRGHGYSSLFHLSKEFPGVLEALFIPGKDAALDAFVRFHGAVAGGKLETVNRYLLFPGGVDEIRIASSQSYPVPDSTWRIPGIQAHTGEAWLICR